MHIPHHHRRPQLPASNRHDELRPIPPTHSKAFRKNLLNAIRKAHIDEPSYRDMSNVLNDIHEVKISDKEVRYYLSERVLADVGLLAYTHDVIKHMNQPDGAIVVLPYTLNGERVRYITACIPDEAYNSQTIEHCLELGIPLHSQR